jgi:GNAT superfamily N-acetyltransferase
MTGQRVRVAVDADIPHLQWLIEISVRKLQAGDYSQSQIEAALGTLLGVDRTLISDGTYFVVEMRAEGEWVMAGCGGWSKRRTLFGSDRREGREDDLLDPAQDAAKIRAFFGHPDWARRGIGSLLLDVCEEAARQAGFHCFEMGATLTGVPLYAARGYVEIGRIEASLPNGEKLPIVRMAKSSSGLRP